MTPLPLFNDGPLPSSMIASPTCMAAPPLLHGSPSPLAWQPRPSCIAAPPLLHGSPSPFNDSPAPLMAAPSLNRLTPRDAFLRQRCVYRYQRIHPDPLKHYTIRVHSFSLYCCPPPPPPPPPPPFLLPNIPLLPHLIDFGQLYFS